MYISNQGKIMRKLLGKPTTADASNDASIGITSSPLPAVFRPNASQNVTYAAGVPIACFDTSPDGRSAVLGGRHILKTVKFEGLQIRDAVDLRAYITAQPANRATSTASTSDQLSIRDVKWASAPNDTTIFTACANGKIFQYDLASLGSRTPGGAGLEYLQMREDSRQVNTLDVNPHRGSLLLSGSQDGFVRFFDIRAPVSSRTAASFRAVKSFKGNAESVRHVKWSPKDGFFFACATEQGVVLKWDVRKPNAPILRISGHDKACTSISWHPDGDHLISAGWDNKCHVWDVSKAAEKRQKAKYTISTPAPVAAIAWRPGQWSATAQGRRAAQVAVAYDESSQKKFGINAVHVWDLARPTLPYKEIARFDISPSEILWHDQDLLWTAGQDGLFNQCDVAFAPKVIDRTPVSSMAFSARGDVLMFLDERPQTRRPRPQVPHADMPPTSSYSSSPSTPMLSISRSDSEDDVVGSFLGPRRRAGRKRRLSTRSATHSLSTTPPTGPDEAKTVPLEQSLNLTGIYKPQQGMAVGPVPSAAKADVYHYLSRSYLDALNQELPPTPSGKPMAERVAVILELFAQAAENVSQFRLAQTWRILGYSMSLLLNRRAQYHLERRMRKGTRGPSPTFERWDGTVLSANKQMETTLDSTVDGDETPRKMPPTSALTEKLNPMRSLLAEEIESTSNVTTPLARPVSDVLPHEPYTDDEVRHGRYLQGKKLTPVLESDGFVLPPGVQALRVGNRRRLDSMPLSDISQGSESTGASLEGYDFYDTESLAKAIDVPLVKKKEPLLLDYIEPRSPNSRRKSVMRQDSDESFAQVFSISQASAHSNSSGGSIPKSGPRFESIAERHDEDAGDITDGEYQSRIRGKQMEASPGSSQLGLLRRNLERTNTDITTTTDEEYRMATQTTSGSLLSQGYYSRSDPNSSPVHRRKSVGAATRGSDVSDSPDSILETDYLPWADDPPYPHPLEGDDGPGSITRPPPLHPHTAVTRALQFETRSSALNASAMVLLLKPLLPATLIDPFQAAAILRQHHSRLMGMKLFVEAALLRNLCVKGWPGGALSDWGDSYPSVSAPAQQGNTAAFTCPHCRKPRQLDRTSASTDSVWRCERCAAAMGPCAVCGHRDATPFAPPDGLASFPSGDGGEAALVTWWYCHGCGHGGHATCLEAWHAADSGAGAGGGSPLLGALMDGGQGEVEVADGCCPLDGCGHACLPGRWRAETSAARSEEVVRAVERDRRFSLDLPGGGGGVRGDGVEVRASRAVESVRESLAGDREGRGAGGGVGMSGGLSSSPGRSTGGERERRKSVKFAAMEGSV